ncbi:unnamed protein product [Paramecium sonneborni]|uniref:Uncharacterized protein n=1 Tax=Paramecium sonneborni TaxID=65129 RepID=A0A8S1K3Z3_9CILI|nr:unnamed protein product [Paramecium sonneborni]
MLQFKGFIIFDLKRSQFFFEMRRDIEQDLKWFSVQKEIRKKFIDEDVLEDKVFEMQSALGKVRGKFDDFQKRFLILIASNQVEDIYLAELLNEIFAILIIQEHYIKFFKEELEVQAFFDVEKKIQEKENYLNQNIYSMYAFPNLFSQIQQFKKLQSFNDLDLEIEDPQQQQSEFSSTQQIIFKGFTIFDTYRQCFYMLIKRGFANDNIWKIQRMQIQQFLLKRSKAPLQHFFLNFEMGQFLFEYDVEASKQFKLKHLGNYFILLTNSNSAQHPQKLLLSKLKGLVQRIPNYQRIYKPELENKLKSQLLGVIEAEEKNYYQIYFPKWIDKEKKDNRKIIKQRGMTEISFQNKGLTFYDELSLTDYLTQRDKFLNDFQ